MARQSFTQLQNTSKNYISQSSGSFAGTTIANFIKRELNDRYQQVQRKLDSYIIRDLPQTASTVASQQRYHYPPNIYPPVEAATLSIGGVDYPLDIVESQYEWDRLNQIDFSGTTIPQFIYPMRDHFELWPIPASAGDTITLSGNLSSADMSAEDYTTGTVTVTNGDATITGSGTTWTASMAGRWFVLTDGTNPKDNWYRIDTFTDTTNMELETVYGAITDTGASYIVGESPEIPPELHELLPHGVAATFFALKGNPSRAQMHNNYFWTGDYTNSNRDGTNIAGGVLAAVEKYSRRSNRKVINKVNKRVSRFDERWSSTLSA